MFIVQVPSQSSKWRCHISANSLLPRWRDSSRFISIRSPSYQEWKVLVVYWFSIFIITILIIYCLLLSFSAGTFLCTTIHQRRIFGWPRAENINFKWNSVDSFLTPIPIIAVNILLWSPKIIRTLNIAIIAILAYVLQGVLFQTGGIIKSQAKLKLSGIDMGTFENCLAGWIRRAWNCLLVVQILSVGLKKLFLRCKLLNLTESERDTKGQNLSTLFSMSKLCFNRDNPIVLLPPELLSVKWVQTVQQSSVCSNGNVVETQM